MAARILLCLVAALLATSARAEPARHLKPEARQHLERGLRLYERGRFDDAVSELRAGLAIDPQPDLLYALGQAERRRGDCKRALEYYESCLALVKEPAAAAAVKVQIERCRVQQDEADASAHAATPAPATVAATAAPAPPATAARPPAAEPVKESAALSEASAPEPPAEPAPATATATATAAHEPPATAATTTAPPRRRWYRDGLGLGFTAAGLAVIGGGGALVGIALSRLNDADQSYQQYSDARSAPALWIGGLVTIGVGAALTLGGIIRLGVVAARQSHGSGR